MKILAVFALLAIRIFALDIVNGDVVVLKLDKSTSELSFGSKQIPLITAPNSGDKIAVLAANYRAKGDFALRIVDQSGSREQIVALKKGEYKKETLSVAPGKIKPPKEALARIKKELDEANAVYAKTTPRYLFARPFAQPSDSKITSAFGNARTFNGEVKSYHSGVDYRAAVGTSVHAVNDGVVVIAKDRYYAGGSVVIDHGGGIYSQYYHLGEIKVSLGDRVGRGDLIALSGESGRVSGPHLHFGIAINGVSVNPLSFIAKFNETVFGER